ncbi:MAG: hypothetical protein FWB91_04080 [Defluviitaleaceae bacterium]|nr:hypothetical protein [Defluviitaleaceae bacterium]
MSTAKSNPFSTGSGGSEYEKSIQTLFLLYMLSGIPMPYFNDYYITKLRQQTEYLNHRTDDLVIYGVNDNNDDAKLFIQAKHSMPITNTGKFKDIVADMWHDYSSSEFNRGIDKLVLCVGKISSTDISNVETLVEWSQYCEDIVEFNLKIDEVGSKTKKEKYDIFKKHTLEIEGNADLSEAEIFEFFKHFRLLSYNLDDNAGGITSALKGIIKLASKNDVKTTWSSLKDYIGTSNFNAGTITLETLPVEIKSPFDASWNLKVKADITRLRNNGIRLLGNIKSKVGNTHVNRSHIVLRLLDEINTSTAETESASKLVIIRGKRGSGKSSVMKTLHSLSEAECPFIFLRAESLDKPDLQEIFTSIGVQSSINDIFTSCGGYAKKYLFIDSLEKILELNNKAAFYDLIAKIMRQSGWVIVSTTRDYAYKSICDSYLGHSNIEVTDVLVEDFNTTELQILSSENPSLESAINHPSLKNFICNPFYLQMSYRIINNGGSLEDVQNETEFLNKIWTDVIKNIGHTKQGLPESRAQVFSYICTERAKSMLYSIPTRGIEADALYSLRNDDLISLDEANNEACVNHDFLEDIGLIKYIAGIYRGSNGDVEKFINTSDPSPAFCRAFRLWVSQEIAMGVDEASSFATFIKGLVFSDFDFWRDDAVIAILIVLFLLSLSEALSLSF